MKSWLVLVLCACQGSIGDRPERGATLRPPGVGEPGRVGTEPWLPRADPSLRLLTRYEYDRTVRDLLGVGGSLATERLPPDATNAAGFDNGHAWSMSDLVAEQHAEIAAEIAALAVRDRWDELVPCSRAGAPECGSAFLASLLPRAFRRPATSDEHATFVALMDAVEAEEGFETAVLAAIEAVLQSPQFLYQIEDDAGYASGAFAELGPHEIASRLSYFLWGSMPDEPLREAAESGAIELPEERAAHVRRMMDDPRMLDTVRTFHTAWLALGLLEETEKDPRIFPEFPADGGRALARGMLAFAEASFEGGLDTLTTSPDVYLTPELATAYGLGSRGDGLQAYAFPAGERMGLLTQPGLLAMLGHPAQHSPILRGVFVREHLLCSDVPPPPEGVAIVTPEPAPDATTRERFANATSAATCTTCHTLINSAGFLFEHYDAIGRYRDLENGRSVDASGSITGIDPSLDGAYGDAVELGSELAGADVFQRCVARQWLRFGLRGRERAEDDVLLAHVTEELARSGDFRALVGAIATSDAMRIKAIP